MLFKFIHILLTPRIVVGLGVAAVASLGFAVGPTGTNP